MIITNEKKIYEKPETGQYIGIIADVVDLGKVATMFGEKKKVRVVWLLDKNDSEGNPFRVMSSVNQSLDERSDLYAIVAKVLGTAPDLSFETDLLLGRANALFVEREADKKDPTKIYANVKIIMPLPANAIVPKIPATFVRKQDQDKNKTAQAQPAQAAPAAVPPAQSAPAKEVAF